MQRIIPIILLILLLPIVNAIEYRKICLNNETLSIFSNFTVCENNNCTDYNYTEIKVCEFGCDNSSTHVCNPSPYSWNINFLLFFGIIVCALIGLLILKKKR